MGIQSVVVWGDDNTPVAHVENTNGPGRWQWRCIDHQMKVDGFHTAGGASADMGRHLAEFHDA